MIAAPKRILVTGGAGFLGSHLCERLLGAGHHVLCVDNHLTGSEANVAHLLPSPRFETMHHDVTVPLHVEVDEIYNLACPASPVHYQRDPVRTTRTSVLGAINSCYDKRRDRADQSRQHRRIHGPRAGDDGARPEGLDEPARVDGLPSTTRASAGIS